MLDFAAHWPGLVALVGGAGVFLALRSFNNAPATPIREKFSPPLKVVGALAIMLGTLDVTGLLPIGGARVAPEGSPGTVVVNDPPGRKTHRRQAGTPDGTGWMEAKSTEGSFSVRVPFKFDDFTQVTEIQDGAKITNYGIGSTSPGEGAFSFTVSEITYPPTFPPRTVKQILEDAEPFLVDKPKSIRVGKFSGVQFHEANSPSPKFVRYLQQGNVVIEMTLAYKAAEDEKERATVIERAQKYADKFFDSLKLNDKPASDAKVGS